MFSAPRQILRRIGTRRLGTPDGEEVRIGVREIYVHYGEGMACSKLRIPAAGAGTARNINTVTRLVALAGA